MERKEISEMDMCEHVKELVRLAVKQARDGGCVAALELSQAALNSANALAVIEDRSFLQAQEINPDGYDDR